MFKKYTLACLMLAPITSFAIKPMQICKTINKCHKKTICHQERVCKTNKDSWLATALDDITGTKKSALDQKIKDEKRISHSLYGISFDEPTYFLPFYYTSNPDQKVGSTPDNQKIMNEEFKAQLSIKFPIWANIAGSTWGIGASYTQLSYWQVYNKSQFFRETDYAPAVYVSDHFLKNWLARGGFIHQSNGRGGSFERSWNRVFFDFTFSGTDWLVTLNPWIPAFKAESSDLHNPNIYKYLGYERVIVAYKYHSQEWSAMVRNSFESGFKRMALEVNYAFPIHGMMKGYVQYFYGYGQSLIEYNHKTNAVGIGIALSNWI